MTDTLNITNKSDNSSDFINLKTLMDDFNAGDIDGDSAKEIYIPLYQRNYKWKCGGENVQNSAVKLAADLYKAYTSWKKKTENNGETTATADLHGAGQRRCKDDKKFNIGMITVYEVEADNSNGRQELQIIDGQQRLITLSLIMMCFLKFQYLDTGKNKYIKWIKFKFERDGYNDDGTVKEGKRYNYLFKNCEDVRVCESVDVTRMKDNFYGIMWYFANLPPYNNGADGQRIGRNSEEIMEFYDYIIENVYFIYRKTNNQPIDEFLNINFKKTPFNASDYIKTYMLMDVNDEQAGKYSDSETTGKDAITRKDILQLWAKLENYVYRKNACFCNGELKYYENPLFDLIKGQYDKRVQNARMDIFFYERYWKIGYYGRYETKQYEYKENENNGLKNEFERLSYYCERLYSMYKQMEAGNDSIYNAYAMCRYEGKYEPKFFNMLDDAKIEYDKIKYGKTMYGKINEPDAMFGLNKCLPWDINQGNNNTFTYLQNFEDVRNLIFSVFLFDKFYDFSMNDMIATDINNKSGQIYSERLKCRSIKYNEFFNKNMEAYIDIIKTGEELVANEKEGERLAPKGEGNADE